MKSGFPRWASTLLDGVKRIRNQQVSGSNPLVGSSGKLGERAGGIAAAVTHGQTGVTQRQRPAAARRSDEPRLPARRQCLGQGAQVAPKVSGRLASSWGQSESASAARDSTLRAP